MNRQFVDLAREAELLKKRFPEGRPRVRSTSLVWRADLAPSEYSRTYRVRLEYDAVRRPRVYVETPALLPNESGELPHIYGRGDLCLNKIDEWTRGDPLAETILPWTCEWLLHYELWLITGEWNGSGGDHTGPVDEPADGARDVRTQRRRSPGRGHRR